MWKVRKSKVHGTGVFATKDINKGTKIIQYIGNKVTKAVGDKISEKESKNICIQKLQDLFIYLN